VDYDYLPDTYWRSQVDRIKETLQKIADREGAVSTGRQIPEDDSLGIGTGKRLQMAILFLDICDFSSWPSEEAEEQTLILNAFTLLFTELIRIAEDYGGVVEKNTGDGLMVYFDDGGGEPPESGSKRAVAAALTMFFTTYNAINPIIQQAGVSPIQFRIGIDHGTVTIAEVGAARRFHSMVAIGTTANVASKILDVTGPNELVIGDQVRVNLPTSWQTQFTQIHILQSGWVYKKSGHYYPFHKYTGRWKERL